jgi:hypothetical protein
LWTEILINLFGRVASIGPRGGDLLGSEVAALLGTALVIVPAWISRRRGLAIDAKTAVVGVPPLAASDVDLTSAALDVSVAVGRSS